MDVANCPCSHPLFEVITDDQQHQQLLLNWQDFLWQQLEKIEKEQMDHHFEENIPVAEGFAENLKQQTVLQKQVEGYDNAQKYLVCSSVSLHGKQHYKVLNGYCLYILIRNQYRSIYNKKPTWQKRIILFIEEEI